MARIHLSITFNSPFGAPESSAALLPHDLAPSSLELCVGGPFVFKLSQLKRRPIFQVCMTGASIPLFKSSLGGKMEACEHEAFFYTHEAMEVVCSLGTKGQHHLTESFDFIPFCMLATFLR